MTCPDSNMGSFGYQYYNYFSNQHLKMNNQKGPSGMVTFAPVVGV